MMYQHSTFRTKTYGTGSIFGGSAFFMGTSYADAPADIIRTTSSSTSEAQNRNIMAFDDTLGYVWRRLLRLSGIGMNLEQRRCRSRVASQSSRSSIDSPNGFYSVDRT
eukprot:scaffold144533_cov53-Attheya_sp.AAC.5